MFIRFHHAFAIASLAALLPLGAAAATDHSSSGDIARLDTATGLVALGDGQVFSFYNLPDHQTLLASFRKGEPVRLDWTRVEGVDDGLDIVPLV